MRFTAEGEVRVTARWVQEGRIEFAVSDTGMRIGEEHLPARFSGVVQVDTRIRRRRHSSARGFSSAKKCSLLLGGRVGVASKRGKGSRFSVLIPSHYSGVSG
jgi:signal transduction histidine kinase